MGVVLIPGVWYPCYAWTRDGAFSQKRGKEEKSAWLSAIFKRALLGFVMVATGFLLVTWVYYTPEDRKAFQNGWWSPLVGFAVAQVVVIFLASLPIILSPAGASTHNNPNAKPKVN